MASALYKNGDADGALAAYGRAQHADPTLYEGWYNAAQVYIGRKDYENAEAALAKACDVGPARAPAWFKRAEIAAARGANDAALEYLTKAVAADAACKEQARASSAFIKLAGDERFRRLIGE